MSFLNVILQMQLQSRECYSLLIKLLVLAKCWSGVCILQIAHVSLRALACCQNHPGARPAVIVFSSLLLYLNGGLTVLK